MKVRTGAVLALGLALIASPGYAQNVTGGAKVGVNFSDLKFDGPSDVETTDDTSMKTGLVVGGFVDAAITPQFSVQPEFLFSMKGAKLKDTDPEIKEAINMIEIPILAKFKFATSSSAKPFIVAGPGLGFVVSAKEKEEGFDDFDFKDQVETFAPSFIIGGGVDINKFLVEVRYDFGLKDLEKDNDSDFSTKDRTFSILVGYSFGASK
jgi:hypothetical protein